MVTGIICEYNPLHLGHKKQLDAVRAADPEGGIVCLMSGNFVQRGEPAVFHKVHRARAAVESGADLVLELPVTGSLSSAEGFACTGVDILSGFCQRLCFGAETADASALNEIARALLSEEFRNALHIQLEKGLSFPAARQAALESMGLDARLLQLPNNILAVEYCKAILQKNSKMEPMVIKREGSYHAVDADKENPSATFLRSQVLAGNDWHSYVPEAAAACFDGATVHDLSFGEQAILYRLKTMTDGEFEALPYGSEGLWRKLMHNARSLYSLESIAEATKSKRYTRTRIDRMILCAALQITADMIDAPAPYARVLAFNDRGRQILKEARNTGTFLNLGETADHPYQQLEDRCDSLYRLFANDPLKEEPNRIYCQRA